VSEVVASDPSVPNRDEIEAVLASLTFLGLGFILYGIGMHLMHLNVVRQLQSAQEDERSSGGEQGD